MLSKLLVFGFVFVLGATPNVAIAGKANAANYMGAWGVTGKPYTCMNDWIEGTDWCIYSKSNGKCSAASAYDRHNVADEHIRGMWVAREINEHGAYFCATELKAANKNRSWSWTEYHDMGRTCYWACRDGYSGDKCQDTTVTSCVGDKIDGSIKNLTKDTQGRPNIEDNIAMFIANTTNKCGTNTKEEHDVILVAIPTDDGYGFYAQPMVFRAKHRGYGDMESDPFIAPLDVNNVYTLCRPGYTVKKGAGEDYSKNSCAPIDKDLCDVASKTFCAGFPRENYDPTIHSLSNDSQNKCEKYFCSNTDMAFSKESTDSANPMACAPCKSIPWSGRNSKTGFCITCQHGEFPKDNKCTKAQALTKQDLMYGVGNSKATKPKAADQCWSKETDEEYKKCVLNQS